jgi:hypothetical protein
MQTILKKADLKLVERLSDLEESPAGWRLLYFPFSKLLEHHRTHYQTTIAINLVYDYLKEAEGYVLLFPNDDLYILCKAVAHTLIDKLIFRMRYLFADDPLAYDQAGKEIPEFCTQHDLSVAWSSCYEEAKNHIASPAMVRKPSMVEEPSSTLHPLTPARLASLEKELEFADLSRVIRKQPICAIRPGKDPVSVFDELYMHIPHLRRLVMEQVDFTSNRWLFRYVTQLLDIKVLDMLARRTKHMIQRPISLNLNIESVLETAFAQFDLAVPKSMKASILFEIQLGDVFADMQGFFTARDHLQKQGYKVCIDGVNSSSFPHIDRQSLGFDLVKIQWNADAARDLKEERNQELKAAVERCGANRVILCRCDTKAAIAYGHALKIYLFQGRYLDGILNPNAKVAN